MENTIYTYDLEIKEYHLDTFGHVNNATYLQIYEEARWKFITDNGYGLDKIKAIGLGPVVLEIKIRFMKELRLREKVTIHSQTTDISRIGTIKQWITDKNGKVCSDVEMKVGLFDTHQRKLVEPTEDWINAIR